MNLNSKGWFQKYFDARANLGNQSYHDLGKEERLYKLVQPTGLLYGHPVQLPYYDLEFYQQIIVHDKMKIIMAESFIHSMLQKQSVDSNAEMRDLLDYTSTQLVDFYKGLYPNLGRNGFFDFRRSRNNFEQAEIYLRKRLRIKGGITRNFWSSFFHNSLLFLDVYYFGSWVNNDHLSLESISVRKENMRMNILKTIASAAFADGVIEREERKLFKYFLKSAELPKERKQEAMHFIEENTSLEEMDFSDFEDSWLIKKYLLELAILTIWSDRVVTVDERSYLDKFAIKLGFSDEELQSSLIALETFVLEHWEKVYYLRMKKDFAMVSEVVISRLTFFVNLNKDRVVTEIHESKELMSLLSKARNQSLTDIEKEKVRVQLIDVLKLIPAFLIIALPFTFITLPILLKILPKSAFPSAFQD